MVSGSDCSGEDDCSVHKMSNFSGSSISCYQDEEFTVTRIVQTVATTTSRADTSEAAPVRNGGLEVRQMQESEPLSITPVKRMFSESGLKIVLNLRDDDFGERYELLNDFRCTQSPKVQKRSKRLPFNPELDDQLF